MIDIRINKTLVGPTQPVYFIADIAANHCGDLGKAKELVHACAESGANAVKMQNFTASTIVSDYGFKKLQGVKTHQSSWAQSVYDSYDAASIPLEWTHVLKTLCDNLGLDYFTSPYSTGLTCAVAPYVSAFKLGSGDITWHEVLEFMCRFEKPVIISTGASTMEDIKMAMDIALSTTKQILLMQCNTNYTALLDDDKKEMLDRYRCINLKVLDTFSRYWPDVPVGLSDHTHGSMTVLGAVGLFHCCAIEKHFTLDNTLEGQDHSFSLTPKLWRKMVTEIALLKDALVGKTTYDERYQATKEAVADPCYLTVAIGDGIKRVEKNEESSAIVQRRAVRSTRKLTKGTVLRIDDLCVLRPCPPDALPPYRLNSLAGQRLNKDIDAGDCVRVDDIG